MMKFFRKYNKVLLAVFMAFLMVVFVAEQAFTSLFQHDPAQDTVLTTTYGPITNADLYAAGQQMSLVPTFQYLQPADVVVLQREAHKYGFGGNPDAIRARVYADPKNAKSVEDRARMNRVSTDAVCTAMVEMDTIGRVLSAMISAAQPSEAEIRAAAREALEKVRIQGVSLHTRAFVDESWTPTDEEAQAQFEKYKDKERGTGLNFGYVIPDSVRLQYVQIHRDAIIDRLKAAVAEERNALGMDILRNARKFYDENKTTRGEFRRPIPPPDAVPLPGTPGATYEPQAIPPTEPPPPAEKPDGGKSGAQTEEPPAAPVQPVTITPPAATPPAPPAPPAPQYLDWEEAKEKALEFEYRRRADAIARELSTWIIKQSSEAWLDAERGEDRYRKTPAGVADETYYEKVLKGVPKQYNFPEAIKIATTDFFAQVDAGSLPVLGGTYQATRRFSQLPFNYQGLAAIPEKGDPNNYLARYETVRDPTRDMLSGDMYVYRPVETRKARPAESLSEVRSKVDTDLRTQRAYDKATQVASNIESAARAGGALKDVFLADPDIAEIKKDPAKQNFVQYDEPEPIAVVTADQAGTLEPSDTGALYIGPLGLIRRDTARKIFELGQPGRTDPLAVIEEKDEAKVFVVYFLEFLPAREDEYANMRQQVANQMGQSRQMSVMRSWLDPDQIKARTGIKDVRAQQ